MNFSLVKTDFGNINIDHKYYKYATILTGISLVSTYGIINVRYWYPKDEFSCSRENTFGAENPMSNTVRHSALKI